MRRHRYRRRRPQGEVPPWQGELHTFYPPTEIRLKIRDDVLSEISGAEYQGKPYTEIAKDVARIAFEQSAEGRPPYGTTDVSREMGRMIGGSLRLAPNNDIFVDEEWVRLQNNED